MHTYKVPEGTKLVMAPLMISWIAEQKAPHFLQPTYSNPEQQRAIAICELMDKHTARINELLENGNMHAINHSDGLPAKSIGIDTMIFVGEVQEYLAGMGYALEFEPWQEAEDVESNQPSQTEASPVEAGPEPVWIALAQEQAHSIVKRQGAMDLYPSQMDIAGEIAQDFRERGIMGASGKPLSAGSIKRHALKDISSAKGRQLSTSVHRGKWGKK